VFTSFTCMSSVSRRVIVSWGSIKLIIEMSAENYCFWVLDLFLNLLEKLRCIIIVWYSLRRWGVRLGNFALSGSCGSGWDGWYNEGIQHKFTKFIPTRIILLFTTNTCLLSVVFMNPVHFCFQLFFFRVQFFIKAIEAFDHQSYNFYIRYCIFFESQVSVWL